MKVIYMYIETRIKLKEGEVALVLLSAQAEERLQKRKFCIMRVRDSGLCSAACAEKQKPTPRWLWAFSAALVNRSECDSRCHGFTRFFDNCVFGWRCDCTLMPD